MIRTRVRFQLEVTRDVLLRQEVPRPQVGLVQSEDGRPGLELDLPFRVVARTNVVEVKCPVQFGS